MEEKSASGVWKIGFFVLLALLIVVANILGWYFFIREKGETPVPSPTPLSTVTIITPTPKELIILSLTPTIEETSLIKQAVFKLTGLNETKAEVTINKNTGKHAKGSIKEFEAVGGAYWIAAKVGDSWIGVYDGQANPTCEQIAPYNFPKEMVPECLDATGKVVKR